MPPVIQEQTDVVWGSPNDVAAINIMIKSPVSVRIGD